MLQEQMVELAETESVVVVVETELMAEMVAAAEMVALLED